jgi:uncharacterized membrane protein
MKILRIISTTFFIIILGPLLLVQPVKASGSLYIENYDVSVDVDTDSTFVVSETISYRATGKYGTIYREVTLEDHDAVERCRNDPSLQCGGFSYVTVTGVYDGDGNKLPDSEYSVYETYSNYEDRLRIEWVYAPEKRSFNNELFTWTIEYKVFGGLGYFDSYDLFYWDVFYPDRSYEIKDALFEITFPRDIGFSDEDLQVFTNRFGGYDYKYDYDDTQSKLTVSAEDLSSYDDFTVMIKFPKGIVQKYASLDLDLKPETQDLWIDEIEILNVSDKFTGIPPGEHNFKFTADDYVPKEITLSLAEGEEKDLQVYLEMTLGKKLIIIGTIVANALAFLGGCIIIGYIILNYIRKGKDIGGRKTIVPWFKPPKGVSPVIVGSIKDEKVHLTDITSTIINAAVRGYIKIKETGKNKYELLKLKDFRSGEAISGRKINYDVLDKAEVRILNDIFDFRDKVTTDQLKNKFYQKIGGINNAIYNEMAELGYFVKRPDHVRRNYIILGIILLILGGVLTCTLITLNMLTCGPIISLAGVVQIIFSFFMPAKTSIGTNIYEKSKGFRMFLHTAERFRMQKLTPKTFERFLPYAMVFGVEKQWAANFKDIYTQPPDWYEGRTPWTTFNTINLARSLSSMNTSVNRVMASSPRSSGGWSGGGWSGGGGFSGGFSGGGGGGGGGGMS